MAGINRRTNVIRLMVLILLLVTIVGPWAYSYDGVPPAEWCRTPNILLENGRCIRLVSGAEVLIFVIRTTIILTMQLVTLFHADRAREFFGIVFVDLLLLLLIQPFFSTLLLIFGEGRPLHRIYHLVTWGLAMVVAGTLLVVYYRASGLGFELWGIWLYLGAAICLLAVELLRLVARSKSN